MRFMYWLCMPILLVLSVGCDDNNATLEDRAGAVVVQEANTDWDQNKLFHEKEILAKLDSDVVRVASDKVQSAAALLRSKIYAARAFQLQDSATITWLDRCEKETYKYLLNQDDMERLFKKSNDAMINYDAIIKKANEDILSEKILVEKFYTAYQKLNLAQSDRHRRLKIAKSNVESLKINHQAAIMVAQSVKDEKQQQAYKMASKIGNDVAKAMKDVTFIEIEITDAKPALHETKLKQQAAQSQIEFCRMKIKNANDSWETAVKNRLSYDQAAEDKYIQLKKHFDVIGEMFWRDVAGAFDRSFAATDKMIRQVEGRLEKVNKDELDNAKMVVLACLVDKIDIQYELLSILKGYLFYLDHADKYSGKDIDQAFVVKIQNEKPRAQKLYKHLKKSASKMIIEMQGAANGIVYAKLKNPEEANRKLAACNASIQRISKYTPDNAGLVLKINKSNDTPVVLATNINSSIQEKVSTDTLDLPVSLLPAETIGYAKIDLSRININLVKTIGLSSELVNLFEDAKDQGLAMIYEVISEQSLIKKGEKTHNRYTIIRSTSKEKTLGLSVWLKNVFPEMVTQADISIDNQWIIIKSKGFAATGTITPINLKLLSNASQTITPSAVQVVGFITPQLRAGLPAIASILNSQAGVNADTQQITSAINKLEYLALSISLLEQLEIDLGLGFLDGESATLAKTDFENQIKQLGVIFTGITKNMAVKTSGSRLEIALDGDNLMGEIQGVAMKIMMRNIPSGPSNIPSTPGTLNGINQNGSQNASPPNKDDEGFGLVK